MAGALAGILNDEAVCDGSHTERGRAERTFFLLTQSFVTSCNCHISTGWISTKSVNLCVFKPLSSNGIFFMKSCHIL